MSNTQVGNVYQQIISDVVESSRVDFEEGGVEEQVLEELRQGWQKKLSQLQVATFPWDPKPEPQPIVNPPTVPSNAGNYQPMNAPMQNYAPPPVQQNNAPRIKTEPGLESPTTQPPFQNPVLNNPNATTAQQRAAQHLQASYGQRAAASINAIQGNVPQQPQNTQQMMQQQQQHQQQQQQHQQQAYNQQQMAQMQQQQQHSQAQAQAQGQPMPAQRPPMTPEQYRQAMAAQLQQRLQNQTNNINNAQTDGAGDDGSEQSFGVIKRGNETMGRVEIDGLIRAKISAMGQSMEGGGLMLPLKQASNAQKRSRDVARQQGAGKAQLDGGDSDDEDKEDVKEEEDEDAINSDLDDPDDGLNDQEDDDEGLGHIMLCMYDKVQRVKNKWKCVMKDGVLTVNGKEYVFHKATGEYEW